MMTKREVNDILKFISSKHKKERKMKGQYIRNIIGNEINREKKMKLKYLDVEKVANEICKIIGI